MLLSLTGGWKVEAFQRGRAVSFEAFTQAKPAPVEILQIDDDGWLLWRPDAPKETGGWADITRIKDVFLAFLADSHDVPDAWRWKLINVPFLVWRIAQNHASSPALLDHIFETKSRGIRGGLCGNRSTSAETLRKLFEVVVPVYESALETGQKNDRGDLEGRYEVSLLASHPNLPSSLLWKLAEFRDDWILQALYRNESTSDTLKKEVRISLLSMGEPV